MKTKILAIAITILAIITACEKDGMFLKVFGLDSSELQASESEVVLTGENAASQVLTFTWSQSDLTLNDENAGIPGSVPFELIHAASSEDFSDAVTITPQNNTYAFTGAALNTLAKNLGFIPGESTPMYFRVITSLGLNTEPRYSNTVVVDITAF